MGEGFSGTEAFSLLWDIVYLDLMDRAGSFEQGSEEL